MKNFRKAVLYTYRTLLFLSLSGIVVVGGGILLGRILMIPLKLLIPLYLPYSAWAVFLLVVAGGIWPVVSETKSQRESKRELAKRVETEHPDFTAELLHIVETCLAKYPHEVRKGNSDFTIFMPDRSRTIHLDIGPSGIEMQIFVGGWDEDSYCAHSPDELKELAEEFSSDLDDWLNDRIVQVCFIKDEDGFPFSFACSADNMDEFIFTRLEGYSEDFWWLRILRIIFLFPGHIAD